MTSPSIHRSVELVDGGEVLILEVPRDQYRAGSATLILRTEAGFETTVDVAGPHWAFGQMLPATVNWAGCGSRSAEAALAISAVLVKAARYARRLGPSFADAALLEEASSF